MFNNLKAVKASLAEYKKLHHKRFYDQSRLNKLIKKCIIKTRYLWIFLIILTLINIIPEDKTINNKFSLYFTIYGPQALVFFVFMVAIIIMAIISFVIIADDYNDHLSNTYEDFKKVLRSITFILVFVVLFLVARTQVYYVKHFLVPPLESCSYIDFYGNELYKRGHRKNKL